MYVTFMAVATQVQHLVRESKKTRNSKNPWLKEMKAPADQGTLKGRFSNVVFVDR